MWKLTITQKRKYETFTGDETISYYSENLRELTDIVYQISNLKEAEETTYKIEKAVKKDGEAECSLEN